MASPLGANLGDQIGRNFAYWVIANFGQWFQITEVHNPHFWPTFFHGKNCINLDKNKFGYALGDCFSQTHLATLASTSYLVGKFIK
jgi:hypothetical protein